MTNLFVVNCFDVCDFDDLVFFLQRPKELHYNDALRPTPGEDPPFTRVRMFSPMEMNFAFVLAAYRDIDDPQKMDDWKRLGLIH